MRLDSVLGLSFCMAALNLKMEFSEAAYTQSHNTVSQQKNHDKRQQTYISAKVFCFFALIFSDVMTAFSSSDFLVWSNNVVCFNFPADCFALTGETRTWS